MFTNNRFMVTIYILTSDFRTNCLPNNRNNPEWLRKQDKLNGSFNIAAPYPKNDYFRRFFIEPLLDDGGYIKEEFWGIPLTTSDRISYCIKKWHRNQYRESFNVKQKNLFINYEKF